MPLNASAIYPASDPEFISYPSRRSVVHSTHGMVACTQPLAAQAGLRILREGGNAADAAVAVAAALNMTEPSSTGIGGDMFALFYDKESRKVRALNGSGRSASNVTLEGIRKELGIAPNESGKIPMTSVHSVTAPGAAAGWVDTVEKFGSGKVTLSQILAPAIELGEEGFPVSELSSTFWRAGERMLRNASPNFAEMLRPDPSSPDGFSAPKPGQLMKNVNLAHTFRLLGEKGKSGFYEGFVAESLIKVVQDLGGHLTLDDLKKHMEHGSEEVEPISLKFNGQDIGTAQSQHIDGEDETSSHSQGVEIWEHPPNGQGIVALMALGILEELERTGKIRKFQEHEHNCAEYLHAVVESLRIAFSDAAWWVTDPDPAFSPVTPAQLISRSYLSSRAKLFDPKRASPPLSHGEPSPAHQHCDTVYFAVTDSQGNGISFINSNYGGFGTAVIPRGCGFTLQNRGANFVLSPPTHPNIFAPNKRPYHTIIPALVTNPTDNSLHTVYGVMGGFMQPQGHVQVLLNMLAFKYNPQAALDAPRICIGAGTPEQGKTLDRTVYLEEGISEETANELKELGHEVEIVKGWERGLFGRGQVIRAHYEDGKVVYSAGSDPRGDGAAIPL
ncbi:gamma-glutamyltranspeptidase [Xylona heveae TC161]|uniref:Gamma-glutamyltranspeptidase n=1 Tax=Xylona heveae (strain CBS 132557 / TC161) TaxID=1328760 RepID=A0A164ZUT7_XYLHT|nr:gamma-glutamyltranspeptidase [Xylona heveae TC161]KZF19558.1 gamma-glutamyltranspeptidase [Xylona heveae TC161]